MFLPQVGHIFICFSLWFSICIQLLAFRKRLKGVICPIGHNSLSSLLNGFCQWSGVSVVGYSVLLFFGFLTRFGISKIRTVCWSSDQRVTRSMAISKLVITPTSQRRLQSLLIRCMACHSESSNANLLLILHRVFFATFMLDFYSHSWHYDVFESIVNWSNNRNALIIDYIPRRSVTS